MRVECGDIPYYLEYDPEKLSGLRSALLQLPDGLKQYSREIADCLSSTLGANIIIDANSTYGACDLRYEESQRLGVEAIIHVGHTPYPDYLGDRTHVNPSGRVKVVFVAARFKRTPGATALEGLVDALGRRGIRRVGLVTTTQYIDSYRVAKEFLQARGFSVVNFRGPEKYYEEGQVIGCDYSFVPRGVDGYVIVTSGEFHAIGLYLATLKPVIELDVHKGLAVDMTKEGEKIYARRLYAISQAMDSRRWGVIVGLKTGQYRPWIVNALTFALRRRGYEYRLIEAETLNEQVLRNIDSEWYRSFVVTSCPRIPIDDLSYYEKPILAPGEAFMAIEKKLQPYRFPW